MQSDEKLMHAYQEGSEEAFNLLYQKYSPVVYGYIIKRLRFEEADDFYQKVWRHLHEKRSLYAGQPFAPWFFVLIKNLLVDEYRSLGRQNTRELKDEILEKIHYNRKPDAPDVDELLTRLPPESAELVRKYYLEGASYEDLEKDTGLSQTGLRQRLSRAIRSLRNGR